MMAAQYTTMWHASYPIFRGQTQVSVHEHQVMRQSMWQPTMLQVDKWTPEDESNCCGCLELQPGTSPSSRCCSNNVLWELGSCKAGIQRSHKVAGGSQAQLQHCFSVFQGDQNWA